MEEIDNILDSGYLPELAIDGYYHGKVRDCHIKNNQRIMVTTDRISVFDRVLNFCIPDKGAILNAISEWAFKATQDIIPNHFISLPDPNVMIVKEAEPLPIEVIVRGYLAGSAWRAVKDGTFKNKFGFELTSSHVIGKLRENAQLRSPILTPTTKSATHDIPINLNDAYDLIGDEFTQIAKKAVALYERGAELADRAGLVLLDAKYEFAKNGDGLILIDEIHTPDAARYFDLKLSEHLSKQYIRDLVTEYGDELSSGQIQEASHKYIELYERLTNKTWEESPWPIKERILLNLRQQNLIVGGCVELIQGSIHDEWFTEQLANCLKEESIPYNTTTCSAHRDTYELLQLIKKLNRSIEPIVWVTVAGKSNALSGIVAANSRWPVIACPPFKDDVDYIINIHSTVQTPSKVPVLTILKPENAILAIERILFNAKSLD